MSMQKTEQDKISQLSFSHDGKKVVFDRCRNDGCQIQVYNLETGELAAYQSPKNEKWTMGKYSYDGKRITFSMFPIKPKGGLDLGNMQIAVMDADGKNYKKVTTGPGWSGVDKKGIRKNNAFFQLLGQSTACVTQGFFYWKGIIKNSRHTD